MSLQVLYPPIETVGFLPWSSQLPPICVLIQGFARVLGGPPVISQGYLLINFSLFKSICAVLHDHLLLLLDLCLDCSLLAGLFLCGWNFMLSLSVGSGSLLSGGCYTGAAPYAPWGQVASQFGEAATLGLLLMRPGARMLLSGSFWAASWRPVSPETREISRFLLDKD